MPFEKPTGPWRIGALNYGEQEYWHQSDEPRARDEKDA
jgi:hypothetical protein